MCGRIVEGHGLMSFRFQFAIGCVGLISLVHAIVLQLGFRDFLINVEVVDPYDVNIFPGLNVKHRAIGTCVSCLGAILIELPQFTTVLGCQLSVDDLGLSLYNKGASVEIVRFALLINL